MDLGTLIIIETSAARFAIIKVIHPLFLPGYGIKRSSPSAGTIMEGITGRDGLFFSTIFAVNPVERMAKKFQKSLEVS